MKKVELIARVLCDIEGRQPDYMQYDEPQWRKYESQARMIAAALKGKARNPHNPQASRNDRKNT